MTTYTVNDAALNSAEAAAYFSKADRRIMIGLRAALELLGIPVPNYAWRKVPGQLSPGEGVRKTYADINGTRYLPETKRIALKITG